MEQNKSRSVKQNEELVNKAPDCGYSWVVLGASFVSRVESIDLLVLFYFFLKIHLISIVYTFYHRWCHVHVVW